MDSWYSLDKTRYFGGVISYREEVGDLGVDLGNATRALLQDLHGLRGLEMRLAGGGERLAIWTMTFRAEERSRPLALDGLGLGVGAAGSYLTSIAGYSDRDRSFMVTDGGCGTFREAKVLYWGWERVCQGSRSSRRIVERSAVSRTMRTRDRRRSINGGM